MVRSVNMREFKAKASEIVREVKETREEVAITLRGEEVARLIPSRPKMTRKEIAAWLKRGDELAEEIGKRWPPGLSAADAISEDRSRLDSS